MLSFDVTDRKILSSRVRRATERSRSVLLLRSLSKKQSSSTAMSMTSTVWLF